MESTHTPGPWGIEKTKETNWIGPMRRSRDGKVAEIVCDTDRDGLTPDAIARNDANARLIAAAPDLLAACKAALLASMQWETALVCSDETAVHDAADAIEAAATDMRAAIAKAEGRAA